VAELGNFTAIAKALCFLHDCPFDLAQVQFDAARGKWTGRFLRPLWDAPEAQRRRRALVLHYRLPVVEGRLCLRGVNEVSVQDDSRIGRYTFNGVERTKRGLRLAFNEELKIDLSVSLEPGGTYEEIPVAGIYAVYRQIALVQSGPSLQIEPGTSTAWVIQPRDRVRDSTRSLFD